MKRMRMTLLRQPLGPLRFDHKLLILWAMFFLLISPYCVIEIMSFSANSKSAERSQVVLGRLTAFREYDHARYDYAFSFKNRYYTGKGFYRDGELGQDAVGRKIYIYIDPLHPSRNSLQKFSEIDTSLLFYVFTWIGCLLACVAASTALSNPRFVEKLRLP